MIAEEAYKNLINDINAEKIALDQLYLETLRALVAAKKHIVLMEGKIQELSAKPVVPEATVEPVASEPVNDEKCIEEGCVTE